MKKTLWTLFLLWASSAMKGLQTNQGGQMEITRLKMSLLYVQSIKTFRLLFLSLFGMGTCLVLLFLGLLLFHISLFLYTPWSMYTKLTVGLCCSIVYLSGTVIMLSQIFASDKWLKIFHAETLLDQWNKEAPSKES